MGKGKGRQSGIYGSKSQRAAHAWEWHEQYQDVVRSRPRCTALTPPRTISLDQRPRLTSLGRLNGILRERQYEESFELMERRRRDGFVPPRTAAFHTSENDAIPTLDDHPPGWILQYGKDLAPCQQIPVVESLERHCLKVLSRYIMEYLEAMGREELHAALSLLSPDTLATLSITVSKGIGISDDLAYCIGKHAHVEELSLRSNVKIGTGSNNHNHNHLTDQGLFHLVPRLPYPAQGDNGHERILEDWEDMYNNQHDDTLENRHSLAWDVFHLDGVNVGLKRLELIDCLYLSASAVLALLEKCTCITHLSLAGSIEVIDDGVEVMQALPERLTELQVLDVTRCSWGTGDVLAQMRAAYEKGYSSRKPPIVHSQGLLPSSDECGFLEGRR